MKNVKMAILLTAFSALILAFSFFPVWGAPDNTSLPNRPVIMIQNPGVWAHVVNRHTVTLKSRIQKQGLEMVRILKFRLPEPVSEEQKDKITAIYLRDQDGMVAHYEFEEGDQEYTAHITAQINFMEIYVECASHGLWRQDIRFEN